MWLSLFSSLTLTPTLPNPFAFPSLPSPLFFSPLFFFARTKSRNLAPSFLFFSSSFSLHEQDGIENGDISLTFNIRTQTVSATDPLWIEIAQTGVQGPGGSGGTAPLLKGVTTDQLVAAGLEPPKPGPKPVLKYWTDGGVAGASKGGGSSSR